MQIQISFAALLAVMTYSMPLSAEEVFADGFENCASYYSDLDEDGFGDPNSQVRICNQAPPAELVSVGGDCDDDQHFDEAEAARDDAGGCRN